MRWNSCGPILTCPTLPYVHHTILPSKTAVLRNGEKSERRSAEGTLSTSKRRAPRVDQTDFVGT
eukprot:7488508-Pyramimonas_sp.AAC.1